MPLNTTGAQARVISLLIAAQVAGGRVYDDVPASIKTGRNTPYVEIANTRSVNEDSSGSDGLEYVMTLNIWSEHKGFKEVNDVADAIRAALHRQAFWVGNMNVIVFFDDVLNTEGADGATRQGIVRLRLMCRT